MGGRIKWKRKEKRCLKILSLIKVMKMKFWKRIKIKGD
jgi:hypothetical protein